MHWLGFGFPYGNNTKRSSPHLLLLKVNGKKIRLAAKMMFSVSIVALAEIARGILVTSSVNIIQ